MDAVAGGRVWQLFARCRSTVFRLVKTGRLVLFLSLYRLYFGRIAARPSGAACSHESGEYADILVVSSKRWLQLPVEMLYKLSRRGTIKEGVRKSGCVAIGLVNFLERTDVTLTQMPFG